MDNKFDELTKVMAQSVSRRQALRRFGVGITGIALACFGLAEKAQAGRFCKPSNCYPPCPQGTKCSGGGWGPCVCV